MSPIRTHHPKRLAAFAGAFAPILIAALAAPFVIVGSAAAVPAAAAGKAAHAAAADPWAALDRLERRYRETKSFRVKFAEEITPVGGGRRVREGTAYYRKPDRMRWEFGGEQPETIVSDGKTLYTYQPDLNQVIETPLRRALESSRAASFLLGLGNLRRDFAAAALPNASPDGLVHVALRPKAGGDVIEMGLDPGTADLKRLRLTDPLGDVTLLRFADFQRGLALDPALFVFKVPAGADIVQAPPGP